MGLPGRRSTSTLAAAEAIVDALEIAAAEAVRREEHEKDRKARGGEGGGGGLHVFWGGAGIVPGLRLSIPLYPFGSPPLPAAVLGICFKIRCRRMRKHFAARPTRLCAHAKTL